MPARRQPVTTSFRRQPVAQARFVRRARTKSITAPVGGWNARDAIAAMAPTDAVSLVNWWPRQSDVVTRPGSKQFCDTGETGHRVQSLLQHSYGAIHTMLAGVNGKIYDVSTATKSLLSSGFASDYWVSDCLGGRTFLVNGADTMQVYDGSTLADATFTGVDLSTISFIEVYKERIFAVEKNSQRMWYGGVGSVTGALNVFDFSVVSSFKGNLMLLGRLKGDGGDGGNDDIFLAIFEEGDVIAYTGSDPDDPLNWSMLGKYHIGKPLSRFGIIDADDDLYLLTSRGYEKLGDLAKYGNSAPQRLILSYKIQQAVQDDINFVGVSDDWRLHLWPGGQMLIGNVPRPSTGRCYHARNINTGAWAKFRNFNAYAWSMFGIKCYFGGDDGKIYEFSDKYSSDNGVDIVSDAQPAWNFLGYAGYQKEVSLVQAVLSASSRPPTMVTVGVDFEALPVTTYETGESGTFYYWDQCYWDQAYWFGKTTTYRQWLSRSALGDAIGLRVRVQTNQAAVSWNKTNILFTLGGPL